MKKSTRLKLTLPSLLVIVSLMSGCTAQRLYAEGKQLVEQEQFAEGLSKLREASNKAPRDVEYKMTYIHTRHWLYERAEAQLSQALKEGKPEQARVILDQLKLIDLDEDRLRQLHARFQAYLIQQQDLKIIDELMAKQEFQAARYLNDKILVADPVNPKALINRQKISQQQNRHVEQGLNLLGLRKTVTLEFRDAPVRQVFEVIARASGLNFIWDREVRGDLRASINLKNTTVEAALDYLLLTSQLEKQILNQNTVLLYPATASKQKEYQEQIVKSFYLANADAKAVAASIKTLARSKEIVVDEKLNMLIMRDSADVVRLAEQIIAMHDVPESEVMLEVEVIEIKRSRLLDFGIQWPNSLGLTPLPSGSSLTIADLRKLNSNTIAASVGNATLRMRREAGDVNILANPSIRAKSREKARIMIGERVPNISTTTTATGFVSESINYQDVGLKFEVEPIVRLDGEVEMKVVLEVSSITNQMKSTTGTLAYQIGTRNANTTLRLRDGETQILAGLISDEERSTANRVPFVGELPVVGRLFGNQLDDKQKTEIVLSITPRIIRNLHRHEVERTGLRTGTESFVRLSGRDNVDPTSVNENNGEIAKSQQDGLSLPVNPAQQNQAEGYKFSWRSPAQLGLGEVFKAQLLLESQTPVRELEFELNHDAVIELVSINEGIFMQQGGGLSNFASQKLGNGNTLVKLSRVSGGATSLGSLLSLQLRALNEAEKCQLNVKNLRMTGLDGKSQTIQNGPSLSLQIQKP